MDYKKEIEQIKDRFAAWEEAEYRLSRAVKFWSLATLFLAVTVLVRSL